MLGVGCNIVRGGQARPCRAALNLRDASLHRSESMMSRYAVLLRGTSNDASPDTVEPAQIDLIALTDSRFRPSTESKNSETLRILIPDPLKERRRTGT